MRLVLMAAAACAAMMTFAGAAEAGEVRITLRNVEARPGEILTSLQTEAQFMRGRGEYGQVLTPPAGGGDLVIVFRDVAPGDYAFSAMHDQNSDQQMQMQPSGMPAEGYAMSHAGAMTGPPTFAVAKFTVGAEPVLLTEEMFYPYVPPAR